MITRLNRGQVVQVLGELTHKKAKADEPAKWYRIALPTNTPVWVHADYVDKTAKTVKPKKLNLRGGPGENFSVLGVLEKDAPVNIVQEKGNWLRIEVPASASGFVAAHLLSKDAAAVAKVMGEPKPPVVEPKPPLVAVVKPPAPDIKPPTIDLKPPVVDIAEVKPVEPVVIAANVTPPTPVVPPVIEVKPPTATPPTPPTPPVVNPVIPVVTPPATIALETNPPPAVELVKRTVTREGFLRASRSIQAPSYFELRNIVNNRLMDYIWSPNTNIMLATFKGRRVVVSGEELLDERWPDTPVITVETIGDAP